MRYLGSTMNASYASAWNHPADESCGALRSLCSKRGGHGAAATGVASGGFQWYEQDAGDEVADEILAWAAAEEAEQVDAGPAGGFALGVELPA